MTKNYDASSKNLKSESKKNYDAVETSSKYLKVSRKSSTRSTSDSIVPTARMAGRIIRHISETVQDRRYYYCPHSESRICELFIGTKIRDLRWPWTALTFEGIVVTALPEVSQWDEFDTHIIITFTVHNKTINRWYITNLYKVSHNRYNSLCNDSNSITVWLCIENLLR